MRIGCLQFAPQVGDVSNNLNRADAVLSRANPEDLDLLVLPELAFTGYNFKSLQEISPFLEPTTAGISSLWARTTALKYDCFVVVGYPEKVDVSKKWPASPEYYNSAIAVSADGETIANYRKTFLYYTDETWALEGPTGFYEGEIQGLGNVAMGICMDLNPYKFEAPWCAWEFANHVLDCESNLVILSMAWLTREDARSYSCVPKEPDMDTLSYWLARLEPLIRADTVGEIIIVLANRCGVEGEAVYAGSSAVLGVHNGEVNVYGILGRGERELLVVDTKAAPQAKLVSQPHGDPVASNSGLNAPEPASRTASAVSTKSGNSINSTLSINTAATSPLTPEAMDYDYMDQVTPISPVEPSSPSQFFTPRWRKPEIQARRASLMSTIASSHLQDHAEGEKPADDHPQSLHSWGTVHTQREHFGSSPPAASGALSAHPSETTHFNEPLEQDSVMLPYGRPPSTKSRNASRTRVPQHQEPALISYDLAEEPLGVSMAHRINSPPMYGALSALHSASAVLEKNPPIVAGHRLSPGRQRSSSRPKSSVW